MYQCPESPMEVYRLGTTYTYMGFKGQDRLLHIMHITDQVLVAKINYSRRGHVAGKNMSIGV